MGQQLCAPRASPAPGPGFRLLRQVVVAKTDGEARAVFKAPPNLGAFVVRAFVAWPNAGPGKAAISTKCVPACGARGDVSAAMPAGQHRRGGVLI